MAYSSSTRVRQQTPTVLVIDDSSAVRNMVSWALTLDGFEPVEVANGQEAISWLQRAVRAGHAPAAILVDLFMPAMDGQTFLSRLAELARDPSFAALSRPAVVVITAYASGITARSLGVERVVKKPFSVRELVDTIHILIS